MTLKRGDRLGDWVIDRPLGEGGMGSVYRAHSVLADDVLAAVKVLKASEVGEGAQRFVQELRTLAALRHPAIVQVQGGGRDEARNLVYMAMELVDGEDLSDRLARGPMSPAEATAIFGPVADALAYAHARGVAHRDIKPSNIMLRRDGTPAIVDFGIAVAEGRTRYTREGLVPGTMVYLPPETFEGLAPDPKSTDAYALGVVMWEAITGEAPFAADPSSGEGQQLAQVMGLKLRSAALDPGAGAGAPLRDAIRRTTDPEPATRLVDLAAVRDLLTTGHTSVVRARPRRRRAGCAAAVAALLLVGVGLVVAAIGVGAGLWWWSTARSVAPPHVSVDLAATLDEAARALERGDLATGRRAAGLALDDHPEDPTANLVYGQALLADGAGVLARPYLCAAVDAGLGATVPGHGSGDLDCDRGPGATTPLTAPLAAARLDLSRAIAAVAREAEEASDAVADAEPSADSAPSEERARASASAAPGASAPAPPAAPRPAASSAPARPAPEDRVSTSLDAATGAGAPAPAEPATGSPAPAERADRAPAPASPGVELGRVSATGLDQAVAARVLRAALSDFRACWGSAGAEVGAGGRVAYAVEVDAYGAVTAASVTRATLRAPRLDACVLARVRRLQFGSSAGSLTFDLTFPSR